MRYVIHSSDIKIEYGIFDTASLASEESRCHIEYEITYVNSGNASCIIEGNELSLGARSLSIFPPMAYHAFSVDSSSIEAYTLHFSREALSEEALCILVSLLASCDGGAFFPAGSVSDRVISAFERFEVARELKREERGAYMRALLTELVVLCSTLNGEQIHYRDEELGARVVRYLNENIDKDLSLDKLSSRFFVSKYYLCRAFKKQNGISIHSYVNHKRIMYAKQLIESGETASGAAYKVGFGDYSAFYRAYVKILGTSPTGLDRKDRI